ncbi:DUF2573 family protein [Gottfriedia acidiceleris]|uniref:YusU family protein n=1 Tax=Gottfriedia acidiceleris TaxID=371036 RepID=A0ABY4JM50_9BACI|nr:MULTISPECIES: DUF2573 family protein [Bacillaceae]PEC49530.1 hypothetical protein CON00_10245 [Bacillus sp. AFS096315]PEJ58198.1 hypothetical protein CN692_07900 [Bacillus sp. AFS002410]PEL12073.1 hypothetical protein CN601_08695 [Bacillus sp. AFS017336]PFH85832.1 hypothetical protein COI44_14610 [Bacillus sp. AFS088145]PFM81730.1 hypothetical protein COJ46_06515 [Bacillus sp. AFS077874]
MENEFEAKFDALLKKYTELLLGDWSEEKQAKVEKWVMYTYISKSMPALVKHWNDTYPQAKDEVVNLIKEIKTLNDQHREAMANKNKQ